MALNTSHANNGVLLHAGESILLFCDNVSLTFSGQAEAVFHGDKKGRLYLTTHRMIYNAKNQADPMKSFSFPFVALKDVELEQPIFGSNFISGKVRAQPNGNFNGEVKFKLHFKSGGAIDFGTAMLCAAKMASRNYANDAPPPYMAPSGPWYAAPPPAYGPDPNGYMGWTPPTNVFSQHPPANSVYMTDAPPPYPGINGYNGYAAAGASAPPANGSAADAKAAEAAASAMPQPQNGWYDPNNPHTAYVPQGFEHPPSYDDATKKNK
eukprot:maker-scaffold75_size407189-snap-gene-1.17 protein:Tk10127 transcript:maker-scaffold75_size407189-snap-gene-1.17-mRNA-1 annotation:"ww domain-binding protein 2"